MLFQVDFNKLGTKNDEKHLKELGCSLNTENSEFSYWKKEINSLEELKELQEKLWELTNSTHYMLLIDFENPWVILLLIIGGLYVYSR